MAGLVDQRRAVRAHDARDALLRGSFQAAWEEGMEAVVALTEWAEAMARYPAEPGVLPRAGSAAFIATMDRWMHVYCSGEADLVPGLGVADARAFDLPTLVFRSGANDIYQTRATSQRVAGTLPNARMVEPPWGDRERIERSADHQVNGNLFACRPWWAPPLVEWSRDAFV